MIRHLELVKRFSPPARPPREPPAKTPGGNRKTQRECDKPQPLPRLPTRRDGWMSGRHRPSGHGDGPVLPHTNCPAGPSDGRRTTEGRLPAQPAGTTQPIARLSHSVGRRGPWYSSPENALSSPRAVAEASPHDRPRDGRWPTEAYPSMRGHLYLETAPAPRLLRLAADR
jgi:hypothetical protein